MTDIALEAPKREARVMGVVGLAHCVSHFFQIVLPMVFPLMQQSFGVDFTALGFLIAVFFSVSAFMQVAAGFVVDRVGAQLVLPFGIACLGLCMLGVGFAQSYWMLPPLAALGGLGNAVFHPADYSILTAHVSQSRLARAYSIHTVSGSIGWAIAPVTMATLSLWVGWRGALMAVGIAGLLLAVFVASERSELVTARHHHAAVRPKAGVDAHMLLSTPILMAFTYFTLLALAGGAAQNFFPSMLPKVQQVTFQLASAITTFYLSASAFGSFAGGYVADMTQDHERIVGAGLLTAAVLALLIGFVPMPTLLLFVVATMMGFLSGLTVPSRDMLVRAATPPGATGKVFGFVYSGLDLGSLVAPLVAGKLIDQELTPLVFMFIAVTLAATVGAAVAVKHSSQPAPARH